MLLILLPQQWKADLRNFFNSFKNFAVVYLQFSWYQENNKQTKEIMNSRFS